MAKIIVDKASLLRFIDMFTVFIKQEWAKARRIDNARDKQCKEVNASSVEKYSIPVHVSITILETKDNNEG